MNKFMYGFINEDRWRDGGMNKFMYGFINEDRWMDGGMNKFIDEWVFWVDG